MNPDVSLRSIYLPVERRFYLIDWENAFVGDPAYDLSIVTRGVWKPFGVGGGLGRLLDSYLSSGGQDVSRKDVRVYELLMCIGWHEQSLDRSQGGHGPGHYLGLLRGMLKRAGK